MKKALALFFIFIFSLSIIGIQVSVHHCMGKNAYTILGIDFNKSCKCRHSNEEHKSKCCDTKKITVKAEQNNYRTPSTIISFQKLSFNIFFLPKTQPIQILKCTQPIAIFDVNHSPPNIGVPINTLFCTYRI